MASTLGIKAGANIRKIRTLALSVFFNMWLQMSSLVYSAATVFFLSKEYWGAYTKILISISFYAIICNWGSREYLTTNRNADFKRSVFQNLLKRLVLFFLSAVFIFYTFPDYAAFSILLLLFKFINSAFEIIIYKERIFKQILRFELLFLMLFLTALFLFSRNIQRHFNYFLFIFLLLESLRTLVYFITTGVRFERFILKSIYFELKSSFFFFINALFGFYASRIDSLLTVFFFTNLQIATYQIAFNFVYLFQGLSNFIFYTYSFHFYRLNTSSKKKLIRKYITIGLIISLFFPIVTAFFFKYIYYIQLELIPSALLCVLVLLSFIHQPFIYLMYQSKKTLMISIISFVSIVIFVLFLITFNSMSPTTVFNNLIYASVIGQIFRSSAFVIIGRKSLTSKE